MSWSWRIGRIAGIDVYIHATFLILLAWVAYAHFVQRYRWEDAAWGLLFIVALFGIIVLHELGHALTARHFGIGTRDITLLPIGGLARLERMPEDPRQELWVALAGPAVNVVLAGMLFVLVIAMGTLSTIWQVPVIGGSMVVKLMWVNVVLAVFNLLPAFPMDGGRVLRALLALNMNYVRATEIAANVGQAMALVFGLLGLMSNPFLLFIALFVWVGAAQEAGMVAMKAGLSGVPVREAMMTDFHVLHPHDPVRSAVDIILQGFQHDFPVVEDGRVVGILTRSKVTEALARQGPEVPVREVMRTDFVSVEPNELLEDVLMKLNGSGSGGITLPVVRQGRLVGLLNQENVAEFMAFRPYLKERQLSRDHVVTATIATEDQSPS